MLNSKKYIEHLNSVESAQYRTLHSEMDRLCLA